MQFDVKQKGKRIVFFCPSSSRFHTNAWHHSFMCVTWFNPTCDVTHSYGLGRGFPFSLYFYLSVWLRHWQELRRSCQKCRLKLLRIVLLPKPMSIYIYCPELASQIQGSWLLSIPTFSCPYLPIMCDGNFCVTAILCANWVETSLQCQNYKLMLAHASSLVVYVSFQSIASSFFLFFVSHCVCLYVFVIIIFSCLCHSVGASTNGLLRWWFIRIR